MKVNLMLDTEKYTKKPTGYETGGIQQRIQQTELEIEDLALGLCNGMTCKPALLNGSKSVDWIQQQVFALDFDHDTTIEEQLHICSTLNINPVFSYTSFSHSNMNHHFRIVFVTDEVITNIDKRNKLQITLINLFDKSDKVTYDPTRIFYGGNGKQPIQQNYDSRINADAIISQYYKNEYEISKPIVVNRSCNNLATKTPINDDYLLNIQAIKSLNVDVIRGLIGQLKLGGNKEDYIYLLLSTPTSSTPHIFKSENDLYTFINHIDLGEYLGIGDSTVNCILPDHEDNTPSAHIYYTDDGTPIYKCFGCGSARTITTITEELADCTRSEAIEFIKKVYNIELVQSEWTMQQKQLLINCANYLDTTDFKETFPQLAKIIRTRKLHIQKMLVHFTQYVNEDLQIDGKPLFFASYNTLMNICELKGGSDKMAKSITLFTLLNMLDKVELNCVPTEELNKAKSISAKYGFKKLTNFYQFGEYGFKQFKDSEIMAKVLIENNFTLKGISREYVLRTFGIKVADKVFPQYKFENARGTSKKSDDATMRLSNKALKIIEKKGYVLERNIRGKGQTEIQWKKSIQEILDLYGLVRVKASSMNKKKYNIPMDIQYQSFVIVRGV